MKAQIYERSVGGGEGGARMSYSTGISKAGLSVTHLAN